MTRWHNRWVMKKFCFNSRQQQYDFLFFQAHRFWNPLSLPFNGHEERDLSWGKADAKWKWPHTSIHLISGLRMCGSVHSTLQHIFMTLNRNSFSLVTKTAYLLGNGEIRENKESRNDFKCKDKTQNGRRVKHILGISCVGWLFQYSSDKYRIRYG